MAKRGLRWKACKWPHHSPPPPGGTQVKKVVPLCSSSSNEPKGSCSPKLLRPAVLTFRPGSSSSHSSPPCEGPLVADAPGRVTNGGRIFIILIWDCLRSCLHDNGISGGSMASVRFLHFLSRFLSRGFFCFALSSPKAPPLAVCLRAYVCVFLVLEYAHT